MTNVDLDEVPSKCTRPKRWWRMPGTGEWILAPHAPLIGKARAVAASEWKQWMWYHWDDGEGWVTRRAALYTKLSNMFLLDNLIKG